MKGKLFRFILILLLVTDVAYSFLQHYHMFLDGDMATVILPSDGCRKVLTDPFGFSALRGEHYVATNRYFLHASMYVFFNTVPFICQYVVDPVDSLYLSCAIAKTGIQLFLIWILTVYISGTTKLLKKEFLIAAVLITPLFQTWGYNQTIGIIDQSISYTFAYALPLGLIMLYFLPMYLAHLSHQPIKSGPVKSVLLLILAVTIAFNGPLAPPVTIIVCSLFILHTGGRLYANSTLKNPTLKLVDAIRNFPGKTLFFLLVIVLLSIYSFYIGTFNDAFSDATISLAQRYKLLPKGLYALFTKSKGPWLIVMIILVNSIILFRQKKSSEEAKSILNRLKWILLFSIIYILLLPLGGYRIYRPLIIRYDTFMPVTMCFFYYYGISTLYVIKHSSLTLKLAYLPIVSCVLLIFTAKDINGFIVNRCERESLKKFSNSTDKVVLIESDCNIMAWEKITDPYKSRWNTRYLQKIGVIPEEKYYYQK